MVSAVATRPPEGAEIPRLRRGGRAARVGVVAALTGTWYLLRAPAQVDRIT
jgi:hypothetical protein